MALAARSDPLTDLMNRRAMMERFKYQLSHYRRNRIPFTVLLCDVDHFKQINDRYGHAVGDCVLKSLAGKLKESLRGQDSVARWGGEEFLIVLPDTDLSGGLFAAEKIRSRIAREGFQHGTTACALTLSIGVACYDGEQTIDDCIKAADEALYRAKQQGRNRVVAVQQDGNRVVAAQQGGNRVVAAGTGEGDAFLPPRLPGRWSR